MASAQTSSLDLGGFPTEILQQIMGPLKRKELKALRLMNSRFRSIASERLFEHITLSTNDASFSQLIYITASEFWSQQVRHVDWILLSETRFGPGLVQRVNLDDISSLGSRVKDIRTSGLQRTKHASFYGLDLQCQLMTRIPHVQTVRFRCADQYQREGREEWEPEEYVHDLWTDTTNLVVHNETTLPERAVGPAPSIDDIFSVMLAARLRPTQVETLHAKMLLRYAKAGTLQHVRIIANQDDAPGTTTSASSSENLRETAFVRPEVNGFGSLAESVICSLETVDVSGIHITMEQVEALLERNSQLQSLRLRDVVMAGSEPIVSLLLRLRRFHRKGHHRHLRVSFQDTRARGFRGKFSATHQEVRECMAGDRDDLFDAVMASFFAPEEEGYELGSRFVYEDEEEIGYEYDTEEETIDSICRQSIQEYCAELGEGLEDRR